VIQIFEFFKSNFEWSTMVLLWKIVRLHDEELTLYQKPKCFDYYIQHMKFVENISLSVIHIHPHEVKNFHITFKISRTIMVPLWRRQWDSIMKYFHLNKSQNALINSVHQICTKSLCLSHSYTSKYMRRISKYLCMIRKIIVLIWKLQWYSIMKNLHSSKAKMLW